MNLKLNIVQLFGRLQRIGWMHRGGLKRSLLYAAGWVLNSASSDIEWHSLFNHIDTFNRELRI